jgi:hypothetical protein
MEFHVHQQNAAGEPVSAHIMTTTSADADDDSPLQLISAAKLAYYERLEAELAALKGAGNV